MIGPRSPPHRSADIRVIAGSYQKWLARGSGEPPAAPHAEGLVPCQMPRAASVSHPCRIPRRRVPCRMPWRRVLCRVPYRMPQRRVRVASVSHAGAASRVACRGPLSVSHPCRIRRRRVRVGSSGAVSVSHPRRRVRIHGAASVSHPRRHSRVAPAVQRSCRISGAASTVERPTRPRARSAPRRF